MSSEPRLSPPVKKGLRSIIKGVALTLAAPFVAVYNIGQTIYQAYKGKLKKGGSYFIGVLGSIFFPMLYFLFLEFTGAYRIFTNRKLPYDNPRYDLDYVKLAYGLPSRNFKLPRYYS